MPTVSNPDLLGTAPSSPPIPRATDRIPELDGLRGIAIGLILILHFFQNTLNPQAGVVPRYLAAATRLTWSGVDLFFVLSGFLIGGILLDARTAPNYYRVFYARRLFRIVPIYIVFLGADNLNTLIDYRYRQHFRAQNGRGEIGRASCRERV